MKALESSWDKKNFALFCEMGTGKSKILLDNISMLYDKGKINAALIVAPKGVYRNWVEQEIPKHVPDHINCRTFHWVAPSSRTKDDKQMLSQLYDETRDPCLTFFVTLSCKSNIRFIKPSCLTASAVISSCDFFACSSSVI